MSFTLNIPDRFSIQEFVKIASGKDTSNDLSKKLSTFAEKIDAYDGHTDGFIGFGFLGLSTFHKKKSFLESLFSSVKDLDEGQSKQMASRIAYALDPSDPVAQVEFLDTGASAYADNSYITGWAQVATNQFTGVATLKSIESLQKQTERTSPAQTVRPSLSFVAVPTILSQVEINTLLASSEVVVEAPVTASIQIEAGLTELAAGSEGLGLSSVPIATFAAAGIFGAWLSGNIARETQPEIRPLEKTQWIPVTSKEKPLTEEEIGVLDGGLGIDTEGTSLQEIIRRMLEWSLFIKMYWVFRNRIQQMLTYNDPRILHEIARLGAFVSEWAASHTSTSHAMRASATSTSPGSSTIQTGAATEKRNNRYSPDNPADAPDSPYFDLNEPPPTFDQMRDRIRAFQQSKPTIVFVVGRGNDDYMGLIRDTRDIGNYILVGPETEIRAQAEAAGVSPDLFEIIPAEGSNIEASTLAGSTALERGADFFLRGLVSSQEMVSALLHIPALRTPEKTIMSHSMLMQHSTAGLVIVTDAGILPEPTDDQLIDGVIPNSVRVSRAMGTQNPRIALLAATEREKASIPLTTRWVQLSQRVIDGNLLPGTILHRGPLAINDALSARTRARKGIVTPFGDMPANILVVSTLHEGNHVVKTSREFGNTRYGGFTLGGIKLPILIFSRGEDRPEDQADTVLAGVYYYMMTTQFPNEVQ